MPKTDLSKFTIEPFDGKNFSVWKWHVSQYLKSEKLMPVLLGTRDAAANEDEKVNLILAQSMTREQLVHIISKKTPKEKWDHLCTIYESSDDDAKQRVHSEFFSLEFEDGEDMATFLSRVSGITTRLEELKTPVQDMMVVAKILSVLPASYQIFRVSWASTAASEKTMANLTNRLLQEEVRQKESDLSGSGSSGALFVKNKTNPKKSFNGDCFNCGKKGHRAADCRQKKSGGGKGGNNGRNYRNGNNNNGSNSGSASSAHAFGGFEANNLEEQRKQWLADSGASSHMCPIKEWFEDMVPYDSTITVANGAIIKVQGRGTIRIMSCGTIMSINNVLFIPELTCSLFSLGVITQKNFCFSYGRGSLEITKDGKVVATGKRSGNLFLMDFDPVLKEEANLSVNKRTESLELWHQRLAHTHLEKVIKTIDWKGKVPQLFQCESCLQGKSHRQSFLKDQKKRESVPGGLIHADLAGPMSTSTPTGSKYYLLVKDDHSGMMFVYFLKDKSLVTDAFRKFLVEWKAVTKSGSINSLRTDNGTEFTCGKFQKLLLDNGINHEVSCPYTPEQNGFIERAIRTVTESARTMIQSANCGNYLWAEAVNTAVYVLNRVTVLSDTKSPLELVTGRKPSIDHLRIFGSRAFAHVRDQGRTKWDSKAVEMMLVGYGNVDGVYRLWLKSKRKMFVSRDVKFIEPDPKRTITLEVSDSSVKLPEIVVTPTTPTKVTIKEDSPARVDQVEEDREPEEVTQSSHLEVDESEEEFHSMSPMNEDSSTPGKIDGRLRNIPKVTTYRDKRPYNKSHLALMATTTSDEPRTYSEAITCDKSTFWKKAMDEEMKSLEKNRTWILVDRTPGMNVVSNKWVYKVKTKADGSVDRYKARLVAKGFTQKEGIDYTETFSPVVRYDTIRCLLSLACQNNMNLTQFDVKTAFLNGYLEEVIFMEEPLGFETSSGSKVCKLTKSIYGLKQASRAWNTRLKKVLIDFGLKQSLSDPCLFVSDQKDLYLMLYVDDGLVISSNPQLEEELMVTLQKEFEITTGDCSSFCGLQIIRKPDQIILHQETYCRKVLERFKMEDARSVSTPADSHIKLVASKEESDKRIPYPELIGSLLYLSNLTRPDICFAVNKLAQFMTCYDQSHWTAGKRILRYLLEKPNLGIVYSRKDSGVECYSDSDFAGEVESRRSRSGNVIMMNGGPVLWMSRKQPYLTDSTTEAEFVAASFASRSIMWMRNLFMEVGLKIPGGVPFFIDNQPTIKLIKNPQASQRTMHIDIKYKTVLEKYQTGLIDVKYVPTTANIADIFTKPVVPQVFCNLISLLSLIPVN